MLGYPLLFSQNAPRKRYLPADHAQSDHNPRPLL